MVSQSIERPIPIPAAAGIGIRGPHHTQVLDEKPPIAWLEAHSENFFATDSIAIDALTRIRKHYPLSLHGVGLSLGSASGINQLHLSKLGEVVERLEPNLISEHLCWGAVGDYHLNDLLPLPYTEEALNHIVERIDEVQDFLGRQILIENVSSYMEFKDSTIPEWEFLSATAERSAVAVKYFWTSTTSMSAPRIMDSQRRTISKACQQIRLARFISQDIARRYTTSKGY